MKIYIKIVDADYEPSEVAMVAANSLEEAKFIICGVHSKEEFIAQTVEALNPKNCRDRYKTESGWKQAIEQFEAFNKKKYAEMAEQQFCDTVGKVIDTNVEINVEKPCILWERKLY